MDSYSADYIVKLKGVAEKRSKVEAVMDGLIAKGINQVYLVGCGGSLAVMYPGKYLLDRHLPGMQAHVYQSREFTLVAPKNVGKKSLVIVASHSGGTAETLEAADFARERGAVTIGFCRDADSKLSEKVDFCFSYNGENGITESKMMFLHMIVFKLIKAGNDQFPFEAAMEGIRQLPDALTNLRLSEEEAGMQFAEAHKDEKTIYTTSGGPIYGIGYAYAICILLEMQWIHSAPFHAGDFFHGPFEIIEKHVPLILLMGEDSTRPMAERVKVFAEKYTDKLTVIDSKNYPLPGIPEEVRSLFSPFVTWTVLYRYAQCLEIVRDHSLELRRYMGIVEY